jgi:rubrerythrin
VALDIMKEKGVPLDRQENFTWRSMVREPISKLNDDAFTRLRIILMNGVEMEANRFQHGFARMNRDLRGALARVRRIETHQQVAVNWLLPADQSPLETTIAYEQVAIEVTASLALLEPDPYMAQILRFGLLEDFDHLYRYSALLDRLEGKDANAILQSYTDVLPGRPTVVEHRHPLDDVRESYDKNKAAPITKLIALTILSGEQQTLNYYQNIGPLFADPMARQLYAEIGHIEEQHVTQYESMIDPDETWLEKWLIHEATEVWNYLACLEQETDSRVKAIWDEFLAYELGHLHYVMDLFQRIENRDPMEILPATLPERIKYMSHRDFVREVLRSEVDLRAVGTQFVPESEVPADSPSIAYRAQLNSEGSPSQIVAAGYRYTPGTELSKKAA